MNTKLSQTELVIVAQQSAEIANTYSVLMDTNTDNFTEVARSLRYMQLDNLQSLQRDLNTKLSNHYKVSIDSIELGFDVRTGVAFN